MLLFFTERCFQTLIAATTIVINCRIILVLYDLTSTNQGYQECNIMEYKNIYSDTNIADLGLLQHTLMKISAAIVDGFE